MYLRRKIKVAAATTGRRRNYSGKVSCRGASRRGVVAWGAATNGKRTTRDHQFEFCFSFCVPHFLRPWSHVRKGDIGPDHGAAQDRALLAFRHRHDLRILTPPAVCGALGDSFSYVTQSRGK